MKKAIGSIVFLILLFLVINRAYDILKWKDTTGDYLSATQQLYATEENLMDVVFMGSSHCYCSINPDILWSDYGFSAFNMSTSGQDKDSTYYMLQEVLKTQSPKIVCVELWGLTFEKHGIQGNEYRNMLSMKLSQNSIALIKDYVDEEKQLDYILRWPIVHTRYKELDKYDFVQYELSEYGRGALISYHNGGSGAPADALNCDEIGELTDTSKEWLEKLYQLSVEEDFELVFFIAPYYASVEEQMQINAAKEFAKERGIDFFDFNRMIGELGIDYNQDFQDANHLNAKGAKKLTSYLGSYLEQKGSLEDHRGEAAYYQWDDSYTYYEQITAQYELENAGTIEEYIEQLKSMRHVTYIVSMEGDYDESTLDLENAMALLGLTKEQYEEGGTYICVDGKLQKFWDKDSEEVAIYELNEYDAFKVQNMELVDSGATNLDNIMLNMESVGATFNGISFAVYDDYRQQLISKRGFY